MVGGIGDGIARAFVIVVTIIVIAVGSITWVATYYLMSSSDEVVVDKELQPKMVIKTVEVDGIKVIDTTYVYKINN